MLIFTDRNVPLPKEINISIQNIGYFTHYFCRRRTDRKTNMAKKSTLKSMQPKEIKTVLNLPGLLHPPICQYTAGSGKKNLKYQRKTGPIQEKVLEKFGDYIVGIALLPPEKQKEIRKKKAERILKRKTKTKYIS